MQSKACRCISGGRPASRMRGTLVSELVTMNAFFACFYCLIAGRAHRYLPSTKGISLATPELTDGSREEDD